MVTSPSKTGLLKQIPAKAGGRFQRSGGEACAGGGIGLARRREEVLGKRSRAAAGAEEKEDSCGDAHHHHDPRERSSEAPRGVGGEEDCASTLERDRGKFKPHSIKASIFQVLEEAGPEGLQVSQIFQVTQERGMKDWRGVLTPKCTASASCSGGGRGPEPPTTALLDERLWCLWVLGGVGGPGLCGGRRGRRGREWGA